VSARLERKVGLPHSITTVQDGTRVRLDVNWRFARKL
jgi:hypothetical protein